MQHAKKLFEHVTRVSIPTGLLRPLQLSTVHICPQHHPFEGICLTGTPCVFRDSQWQCHNPRLPRNAFCWQYVWQSHTFLPRLPQLTLIEFRPVCKILNKSNRTAEKNSRTQCIHVQNVVTISLLQQREPLLTSPGTSLASSKHTWYGIAPSPSLSSRSWDLHDVAAGSAAASGVAQMSVRMGSLSELTPFLTG